MGYRSLWVLKCHPFPETVNRRDGETRRVKHERSPRCSGAEVYSVGCCAFWKHLQFVGIAMMASHDGVTACAHDIATDLENLVVHAYIASRADQSATTRRSKQTHYCTPLCPLLPQPRTRPARQTDPSSNKPFWALDVVRMAVRTERCAIHLVLSD